MRSFFKYLFASILGGLIVLVLVFFIGSAIIGGLISRFEDDKPDVKANTVLKLDLSYPIPDRTIEFELPSFPAGDFDLDPVIGLNEISRYIRHAAEDDQVKGIYLKLNMYPSGMATLEEVRDALQAFKDAGKFIVAYGENVNEKALYLSALADETYLNPAGFVEFNGFYAQMMYFAEALDELGIDVQIFYQGKYKSATEPLRRTDMSEADREQTRALLMTFHDHFVSQVGGDWNLAPEHIDSLFNTLAITLPLDAEANGIISGLKYEDEIKTAIEDRLGASDTTETDSKVKYMAFSDYVEAAKVDWRKEQYDHEDVIAVVYAEGTIVDGSGDMGSIGSAKYRKVLEKIREDDKVKAVVLRINSPGGSATASDVILREVKALQEAEKPVIVSMGNLAASGGYFIACGANTIYSQPTTITGSIGVFGAFPVMKELFEDKLHIYSDTVLSNDYADMITNPFRDVSELERQKVDRVIKHIYQDFLIRVAEGRGMDTSEVHEIAQGRVWSGLDAIEIGLVDKVGGLDDAITTAANIADLSGYRIKEYPKQQSLIDVIFDRMDEEAAIEAYIAKRFPEVNSMLETLDYLKGANGYHMRLLLDWEVR